MNVPRNLVGILLATNLSLGGMYAGTALADEMIAKPGDYPNRPITMVVCFGKGGGLDQEVEAMQGPMSEIMGVKVNRVNKAGGGGLNCLPELEQTPADGYTILAYADTLVSKYASGDHDMHPSKYWTPLAMTNIAPTGIFIKGDDERFLTNGKPDWNKVVAYGKKNELSVSNINVAMELVTMAKVEEFFGIKTKQVLFDKPAARYGAVIGGKLDIIMEQPGDVISYVKAGKLAPVLAIWPERWSIFPDTPATGADYGMKWEPLLRFRGYWVNAKTPDPIKSYLEKVLKKAYNSKSHKAFLERKALTIVDSWKARPEFTKAIDDAVDTYIGIFKTTGQRYRKD